MSKIFIASDHAGFELKESLVKYLLSKSLAVQNMGTHSPDSTDYPDYAHPLADLVSSDKCFFGILICGSANGVCMTANKHPNIRAAIAWNIEIAGLARQHNDANVLCLPARYISLKEAKEIVDGFLYTDFEGGRHQRRVDKIKLI